MAAAIDRETIYRLVYAFGEAERFTQDSPVLPDVWAAFAERPGEPIDLLLTPHQTADGGAVRPAEMGRALRDAIVDGVPSGETAWRRTRAATNRTTLVAALTLQQVVQYALPMSDWWQRFWADAARVGLSAAQLASSEDAQRNVATAIAAAERGAIESPSASSGRSVRPGESGDSKWAGLPRQVTPKPLGLPPTLLWAVRLIGTLARAESDGAFAAPQPLRSPKATRETSRPVSDPSHLRIVQAFAAWILVPQAALPERHRPLLYSVSLNRHAGPTVARSRRCVKADAAEMLFGLSCKDLTWAVIDSGIDAEHPAFRLRDAKGCPEPAPYASANGTLVNRTRVVATYDFRLIRQLLSADPADRQALPADLRSRSTLNGLGRKISERLDSGQEVDWTELEPFLLVPLDADPARRRPGLPHGTHVAGILAGDWRAGDPTPPPVDGDVVGICRDLRLIDLRVFDAEGDGDEFTVMSALQFVRSLNAHTDHMVVHGVNLSLSIPHEVRNYACGRTPVCDECEPLVASGLVVVVAAGNRGGRVDGTGLVAGYDTVSITDPGNAEGVITVGATHRDAPHAYGVSYFSSRGPTGDGRSKPDLVAPGEKITAPLPDESLGSKDGTSMAAPHVSGAAALLIARHRELVGRPARVKQILCGTATDLGRERYFQGAGLLDVLRAIQSV